MKEQEKNKRQNGISRRRFLGSAAAGVATFTIVPRGVLGGPAHVAPSDKLNIAFIGAGGKGRANINGCSHHNIYALCDVDSVRAAGSFEKYPSAKRFDDWRVMLDREAKNLDAVVISTPDHSHAVATMAAMRSFRLDLAI